MSTQERTSWVALAVNLVVGVWYFTAVLGMPGEVDIYSVGMARLIIRITFIAIVLAIAAEILLRWLSDQPRDVVAADERDGLISSKAFRNAYFVLSAGVFAVIVRIVLAAGFTRIPAGTLAHGAPPGVIQTWFFHAVGPVFVAHMLLLAIMVASTAVYASRIFYYRRGY